MKRELYRPKSQLAKWKAKIAKAVKGGLPSSVAKYYAAGDGVTVTLDGRDHTVVGLRDMFANHFEPPTTYKTEVDAEAAFSEAPFSEKLHAIDVEIDGKAALARANLLLRLKLLAETPGESVAFGIDFYDGKEPAIYVVDIGQEAFRLDLSFADFVILFEKFGTRRWYNAFLDKRAARAMNVDLANELESSLADFEDPEVAGLRAQMKRGAKKGAWKQSARAKASPVTAAPAQGEELATWCVTPPVIELDAKTKKDPWLSTAAFARHAFKLAGKSNAISSIAGGVRKQLRAKNSKLDWTIVAIGGKGYSDSELLDLAEVGMPPRMLAVLGEYRGWGMAQMGSLATKAKYVHKRQRASDLLAKAGMLNFKDRQANRVVMP